MEDQQQQQVGGTSPASCSGSSSGDGSFEFIGLVRRRSGASCDEAQSEEVFPSSPPPPPKESSPPAGARIPALSLGGSCENSGECGSSLKAAPLDAAGVLREQLAAHEQDSPDVSSSLRDVPLDSLDEDVAFSPPQPAAAQEDVPPQEEQEKKEPFLESPDSLLQVSACRCSS